MTPLTQEQAYFARTQFRRWLQIKEQFEQTSRWNSVTNQFVRGYRWGTNQLSFLSADIDHSALLVRLLEGKEPLPEPPPLEHAYPVYPD